jgi:hypothetical protein
MFENRRLCLVAPNDVRAKLEIIVGAVGLEGE